MPCHAMLCCAAPCPFLLQDLPLLDLHPDRITYASDYFGDMVATATGLIEAGFLYADNTPSEEVSPHRITTLRQHCRTAIC
jgi:glutamyl/glutaminyl-tRNA synthetase